MAKVTNQTRQCVIAEHVTLADSYWKRFIGLMGKPGLPEKTGLWIVPCDQIHAFWMRFEFDAIFVNKENQVVHLIEKMKPWRCSPWIKNAKAVLELNGGVITQTGTQIGDQLELSQ